jgi:hypothetical protein
MKLSLRSVVWSFVILILSAINLYAAEKFYNADFKEWRDQRTNSGFNAQLDREEGKARIVVPAQFTYGKVMTPQAAISMSVTPSLILQVTVDEISPDSALSVEIINAGPPYDGYKLITGIIQPGTYSASIGKVTEWTGEKNIWVAFWLEGSGKSALISKLRIGENLAPPKTEAPAAKKAAPATAVAAAPAAATSTAPKTTDLEDAKTTQIDFRGKIAENYTYFEDWSKGLNGWRDDTVAKGVNTVATVKKGGRILLKLQEKATYGKFSSPEEPIVVDFEQYPYIEVETEREFETGRIKLRLTQARNPDNFHDVIVSFSRPGVYMANIPEVAGWRKKEAFFIEIWLEGVGTEIHIRSIGFSKKMSVLQGVMIPVQSVNAAELAPAKAGTILNISGVADQNYRGQWLEGVAAQPGWDEIDRYGKKLINIGYSEITQKLYFIMAIQPSQDVDIYASIGYDLVNAINGMTWENSFARAIQAKLDFGMVRWGDLYFGNVTQVGSVYDPLFTDLTFKKASTFRGFLWKPRMGDFNFKLFGTRTYTDPATYKTNVFLTGARVSNNFTLAPGSVRVGLNAVNVSRSNGELDDEVFQGKVDSSVYQNFLPSVYLRIKNNIDQNAYYTQQMVNEVTLEGSNGSVTYNLAPPSGSALISDQANTYFDKTNPANVTQGINSTGYIVYRLPLKTVTGELIDPKTELRQISGTLNMGLWDDPTRGSMELSISSDGLNWQPFSTYQNSATGATAYNNARFRITAPDILPSGNVAVFQQLINGTFDSTEGTLARSILSADLKGELFDVNLDAEYAVSIAHNQTYLGERVNHQANAFYAKLSRGFSGALLKASYFQMSPEYETSLYSYNNVDDNDNETLLPDLYPDKAGVVFNDFTNRGYPDREYVVGLYIPEDYLLHESEDRNHNGLLDSRENDHEPDYTYRRDQRGYDISLYVPGQVWADTFVSGLELEARALVLDKISGEGRNQTLDAQLNYTNTDLEDTQITVGVYVASIMDKMSDQYQMFTAEDQLIPISVDYLHNLVVTPSLTIKFDAPWGLKATLLDRYRYNKPFFSELPETKGNETSVDIRYRHYVLGGFSMTPVYQGRFNVRQANESSPIYNTFYLPVEYAGGDWQDIPIFHGFYLKNAYPILNEYNLAVDFGRELWLYSKRGMPEKIQDKVAVGLLRNLPRGYVRLQWELNKVYFPYANEENWGQSAFFAQVTLTF